MINHLINELEVAFGRNLDLNLYMMLIHEFHEFHVLEL